MTQPKATVSEQAAEPRRVGRRTVFAGVGAAGALAAVAAALPVRKEEAQPAPAQAQADSTDSGYQLTEHVRRYYQTARV